MFEKVRISSPRRLGRSGRHLGHQECLAIKTRLGDDTAYGLARVRHDSRHREGQIGALYAAHDRDFREINVPLGVDGGLFRKIPGRLGCDVAPLRWEKDCPVYVRATLSQGESSGLLLPVPHPSEGTVKAQVPVIVPIVAVVDWLTVLP